MAAPSEAAFSISPSQLTILSHLSTLLHLFLARNKNQHRRSIWFRHFCVFRRNLASLLQDLDSLNSIPSSHAARAKKKNSDPILITRVRAQLDHWRDILVPKWHHAFSQVIADQRFSVLGLFLLGVLAEVCQIVGLTTELEEMGNEEVRRAIEAFGREEFALAATNVEGKDKREDAGEVIAREQESESEEGLEEGKEKEVLPAAGGGESVSKGRKRASNRTTEVKRKKKQRKKVGGDAIDDIFG